MLQDKKKIVSTTSISAYRQHKANGYAGQHGIILAVMRPGMLYSRRQIATATRLETSTVAARINEMVVQGLIEVCGVLRDPVTNVTVQAVKLFVKQMEIA